MNNTIKTIMLSVILFILATLCHAQTYHMYYTGKVVYLVDHGGGHITLGLDGGGDGESDLTNDYYGVSPKEYLDLDLAGRSGTTVKIMYHNSGAPDWHLILDSVQVLAQMMDDHWDEYPHIIE